MATPQEMLDEDVSFRVFIGAFAETDDPHAACASAVSSFYSTANLTPACFVCRSESEVTAWRALWGLRKSRRLAYERVSVVPLLFCVSFVALTCNSLPLLTFHSLCPSCARRIRTAHVFWSIYMFVARALLYVGLGAVLFSVTALIIDHEIRAAPTGWLYAIGIGVVGVVLGLIMGLRTTGCFGALSKFRMLSRPPFALRELRKVDG